MSKSKQQQQQQNLDVFVNLKNWNEILIPMFTLNFKTKIKTSKTTNWKMFMTG